MADPPLETVLSNLKRIANDVQTDYQTVEGQLKNCDYVVPENDRNPDGVMKVLAVAVIEAIEKVDLKKVDSENMENNDSKRLANLLGVELLYDCFYMKTVKKEQMFQIAKSPRDMAKYLKKNGKDQKAVKKIIENQFQIKWNITTGEQDINHTFYEFCDTKETERFLKYGPRRAHVEVTLYKECRTKSTSYLQSIRERKEKLCPKVYIKTAKGWKTWDADTEEFTDSRNNQFGWIHKSIKSFIEKNADEQKDDSKSLQESLTKPTLYWAVLGDEDFSSDEKLKLNEIGATQIYVGRANNGIRGRWTKDGRNHCHMMKKCLDNVCLMTNYDASIMRNDKIQLVDARLALAKVREERTALFVMKTFGDEVEKDKLKIEASLREAQNRLKCLVIDSHESDSDETEQNLEEANAALELAQAYLEEDELDLDEVKEYLNEAETNLENELVSKYVDEEAVKKLKEELKNTNDHISNFNEVSNRSKSEARKSLKIEETRHRNGENLEIINGWKPKDMRYGMNYV